MKSDRADAATESEVETATSDDPFPGLFRRGVDLKEIRYPGGSRVVEIDIIVASPREWENCVERHEGSWNPTNHNGVVIATKAMI